MAGGAETQISQRCPPSRGLGTCESARGPDADRHIKLLIQFAVEDSLSCAYSQEDAGSSDGPSWKVTAPRHENASKASFGNPVTGLVLSRIGLKFDHFRSERTSPVRLS
jgi:hypothetical protein